MLEFLAREGATRYDLALIDPPYSFGEWPRLLASLRADLAVLETSTRVEVPPEFGVLREYRYGGTLVTLVEAIGPDHDETQPAEKDAV